MAALVLFVADLIGGLGAILCLVGLLFTIPYASAITTGVVAWYEARCSRSVSPAAK